MSESAGPPPGSGKGPAPGRWRGLAVAGLLLAAVALGWSAWFRRQEPAPPSRPEPHAPAWFTVVRRDPDPAMVRDAEVRAAIEAQGHPWHVKDRGTGIELVLVPPGSYVRGASPGDDAAVDHEMPAHRVEISRPFYLGLTEVTNAQCRAFGSGRIRGSSPVENLNGDEQPVVMITWNEAREFCAKGGFRLPTEAEWEYAARAGVTTRYPWGEGVEGGEGFASVADAALGRELLWVHAPFPWDDGFARTAPAGRFRANGFGLRDMIGNAWEWCQDVFDVVEYARHRGGARDPVAPESEDGRRVLRGGSWMSVARDLRLSARFSGPPTITAADLGCRVARDP